MASLLNRCKNLVQGVASAPMVARPEGERKHHPKRAVKHWRIVMDKVNVLLVFSQLQSVVEEWYPQSQPLHALLPEPEKEPRNMKEVYAAIIRHAAPMAPIKGKTEAKVSSSTCIHPTQRLKGGGNENSSWVVCQDCHARWENVTRASELRKSLKEEQRGGHRRSDRGSKLTDKAIKEKNAKEKSAPRTPSYEPTSVVESVAPEDVAPTLLELTPEELSRELPVQQLVEQQQRMWKELEAQRTASREAERRQEVLMQQLLRRQGERTEEARSSTEDWEKVTVAYRCKCGESMEREMAKKDGPMKGRHYFACGKKRCDAFLWDSVEAAMREDIMSVVSVEKPEPLSKAKRSEKEATPVVEIPDDVLTTRRGPTEPEGDYLVATEESGRRALRRAQRQTAYMQSRGAEFFLAQPKYEQWNEEQARWEEHEGLVPLKAGGVQIRVEATMTPGIQWAYSFEEGQEKHFNHRQRRAIFAGVQEVMKQEAKAQEARGVISEVYSPPRVSSEAEKRGWKRGTCYDLVTGWDLRRTEDRKEMWRRLKQEDPELVVVCPPCTAFSMLQEMNFPKMSVEQGVELGIKVAEWQHKRGKLFFFEQPENARSWEESCVINLLSLPGVTRVTCDMCAYGMNVDGKGLNKKPTGIATNGTNIARRMSRRCSGDHLHQVLMSGRPRKAQEYPKQFCTELVRGFEEDMQGRWILAEEDEEQEPPEAPEADLDLGGERDMGGAVTSQEQAAVLKLHKGLGHPQMGDFIRFMKAARVRGEIIRWTYKHFKCEACEAKPRPKPSRLASIPRTYQPNKVVGIDLFYIPGVGGGSQLPVLSMVDWGTGYHMVELVQGKDPQHLWESWWHSWARTFGMPEVIVCDAGREFMAYFTRMTMGYGTAMYQIGAKAPWQQGRTERHGGHFKELLEKARAEVVITQERELKMLLQEVEQTKNRFSHRSGFSPVQRQIGQWPRTPGELLSDDPIDPMLVQGALVDDLERMHEMRRVAQKAFIDYNSQRALSRVVRGASRDFPEFKPGDYVYVFRVERARKRKATEGAVEEGKGPKPRWVGPGCVVAVEGANLFVTMAGELWKVAREQCRHATNTEHQGIELIMQECQELLEEYKRSANRAGYKDFTGGARPSEEGTPEASEAPGEEGRRVRFRTEVEEIDGELPGTEERAEGTEQDTIIQPEDAERFQRQPTAEEPEAEAGHAGPSIADPGAWSQALMDSAQQAERLEGHPERGAWRSREFRPRGQAPYLEHYFIDEIEGDAEDEVQRTRWLMQLAEETSPSRGKDHWSVDLANGTVTRHHVRRRKALFHPEDCRESPRSGLPLKPHRESWIKVGESDWSRAAEDVWEGRAGRRALEKEWKGQTVFHIDYERVPHLEALRVWAASKGAEEDIDLKKLSEKDQAEWRVADAAEWNKVAQSGGVKVLSLEESRAVRAKLRKEGKEARILPTRIVRRNKPSEQPGVPPTKKSRMCIRGDMDPDIMSLERFAPTVNTMNLSILLQIAANRGFLAEIADFKNAFCQSEPLHRANGPLYFQQPKEGIDGLHPEQVVQIIAGCYGLVDSPLHWRKSLIAALKALGYVQSRLDPCIYKLYQAGRLEGAIAIEVDDLFMVGSPTHRELVQTLKQRFVFGKWVLLKDEPQGAMFNGRRLMQREDGGFEVDMEKFVLERLNEIPVDSARRRQKEELVTEEERSQARGVCGALNWLSKEGRPDASAPASLMSSKITELKVQDLLTINEVVKTIKQRPKLHLKIQPLRQMSFSVVTDASFANDGYHSQGGQMILSHEPGLREGLRVKTNLLAWRSGRIQRVVNSTLAAETQSLSKGMGDLLWMMVLFEEMQDESFTLRTWPERLGMQQVMAMVSASSSTELRNSLAIVDAKSLYDYLSRDTIGGQDKRTAIEVQIIREDLASLNGAVRWVDHPAMLADGLTKLKGSNEPLFQLLNTGMFRIVEESRLLEARSEARTLGQDASSIRRFGIKESLGSCGIHQHDMTVLDPDPSIDHRPK